MLLNQWADRDYASDCREQLPAAVASIRPDADAAVPSYRICGDPSQPWILVLGGISANRNAWLSPAETGKGWWQQQIGPGTALDPERFCILSLDYLSHKDCPEGTPAAAISTLDQADGIARLLDQLGVEQLHSLVGASYGGMVAQAFAQQYPQRLRRCLIIAAAHKPWPLASAWRHIQRQIIELGLKQNNAADAIALARGLAMTTYRSGAEFEQRFGARKQDQQQCVEYLQHCGRSFAGRFSAEDYLVLSRSIDDHWIDPSSLRIPVDVVGFDSDQITPPQQLKDFYRQLGFPGRLSIISSLYGHDAFLKESQLIDRQISCHLEELQ